MREYFSGKITLSLLALLVLVTTTWIVASPTITEAWKHDEATATNPSRVGQYVLINLTGETVTLRDGETTIKTFPIVSQGRPSSYYETIGGTFTADYKEPTHFSTFGHVYMPWSIHVFGNYFIHGIPYYEDGTKVSSSYSGGCVRLEDKDAKEVYMFVEKGTPVIITRGDEGEYSPTPKSEPSMTSQEMTTRMVATISLEFLKQDEHVIYKYNDTTRKALLRTLLIEGDANVANFYATTLGEAEYLSLMNKRAETLGLSNTVFTSLTEPVATSYDDYMRFMNHIKTYKSYLLTLDTEESTTR